jgi:cytochrome c oxidase subunit I
MLVFSIAMTFAGNFGVPRRTWDITFVNAPFDYQFPPVADLMLGITALGGIVASIGGGIYILVTVWSVFFGEPLDTGDTADVHVRTSPRSDEPAPALVEV